MDPSNSFLKTFSFLLYGTWKKKGLFYGDEIQVKLGKKELIKKIIAINPIAEIHLQKYLLD
jgi:hypothetical protein